MTKTVFDLAQIIAKGKPDEKQSASDELAAVHCEIIETSGGLSPNSLSKTKYKISDEAEAEIFAQKTHGF